MLTPEEITGASTIDDTDVEDAELFFLDKSKPYYRGLLYAKITN